MKGELSNIQRQRLVDQARSARKNAYAPYSNFMVGAALLCEDGTVCCGCNMENQAFPAGHCAERAALAAAISQGKRRFSAIAVAGGSQPVTPCGLCRQALAEFGDLEILCAPAEGEYISTRLSRLLPNAFCLEEAKANIAETE